MTCEEFARLIPDLIEGNLSSELVCQAKNHLNDCQRCRVVYQELNLIHDCLAHSVCIETAPDFWDNLHNRISNPHYGKNNIYTRYHNWFNIAATLVAVFGLYWSFTLWRQTENGSLLEKNNFSVISGDNPMLNVSDNPWKNQSQSSQIHHMGWIGLSVTQNAQNQIVVSEVIPNNPAAIVNILPGDTLLSINGESLKQIEQVETLIRNAQSGDVLKIEIKRREIVMNKAVPVADRYYKY